MKNKSRFLEKFTMLVFSCLLLSAQANSFAEAVPGSLRAVDSTLRGSHLHATLTNDCVAAYSAFREGEYRFVIYRITDDLKNIVVESTAPRDATYSDLVSRLKDDQPRFVTFFYDDHVKAVGGQGKSLFISWIPQTASPKWKMMYGSSIEYFRGRLVSAVDIYPGNRNELDQSAVEAKVRGI